MKIIFKLYALALCILFLASCATLQLKSPEATTQQASVIDGSSTVHPISAETPRRYQRRRQSAEVAMNFFGTTGSFRRFCNGEADINDASRPINLEEIKACAANNVESIEVAIAYKVRELFADLRLGGKS